MHSLLRDHLMSTADKATAENAQLRSELIQSQDALKKVTEDCNAANAKLQKVRLIRWMCGLNSSGGCVD